MLHIFSLKFIIVLMFWNQGCVNDSSLVDDMNLLGEQINEGTIVASWLKVKKEI